MQNAGVDVSQLGMYSHEELAPILSKWIRQIDLEIPGFIPYPMLTDFDISGEMTIQHSRPSQLTSRYLLDETTLPYRNLDIVQAQAMTTYQQIEYMTIVQLGYAFEKHGL